MSGKRRAWGRESRTSRWQQVVGQSFHDLWANNAPEWAAALGFYAVLSLFPLLIAGTVVASYVAHPAWVAERLTDLVEKFLPRRDVDVQRIVDAALAERRRVGVLALLVFLLSGRRVLGALTTALNLFSDVEERSEGLKRRVLVELGLLAGVTGLFLVALSAGPLVTLLWRATRVLPGPAGVVVTIVAELVQAALLCTTFIAIYAYVPAGRRPWQAVLAGAGVATLLFYVAQGIFLVIIPWITEALRLIYGPLAGAALLLIWAWYVALVTLIGGAITSHTKVMMIEGQSPQEASRQHVARKQSPKATS
ncbi:MAG: YihY/virulence factor BrkB family protein [Chloroflexota bacterium]|nr:YihY/virulence factor BrkB family protein [Chloroflexota bacterium]